MDAKITELKVEVFKTDPNRTTMKVTARFEDGEAYCWMNCAKDEEFNHEYIFDKAKYHMLLAIKQKKEAK